MIKAIVFDCFGVLVGSSFRDAYRASGGDPVKDAAFITEIMGLANAGLISSRDIAERTGRRLGVSTGQFMHNLIGMERPNEDLFAYIEKALKPHYKIGILSNAERGGPQHHLSDKQVALFDAIIVSGEIGHMKPESEAFNITAERLGVRLEEMVFVDDLARYVEPARSLGIAAVHYIDLEDLKRQLATILT